MRHSSATIAAVLSLPAALGSVAIASFEPPPLAFGVVRVARPGDSLTVTMDAGRIVGNNHDKVVSAVFVKPGIIRMHNPVLTAVVTIKCDAKPGTYPVGISAGNASTPAHWAKVRVPPVDEAVREQCRAKVKKLAPDPQEEQWPADRPWPQSDWDVRNFRPGDRILVTDNDDEGHDGELILVSPAFTDAPVLRGAKAVLTTNATIRCDAKPGLYAVYRYRNGRKREMYDRHVWARYRVEPARPGTGDCGTKHATPAAARTGGDRSGGNITAWAVGGALVTAAGAGGLVIVRRARLRRRSHI
ncbi:hypothetical protein GCM10023196_057480 [Actinoallomurus vinaceus]|uniref:Gram-positive cocci surface proteins LPxTG domain-containing protein n=1 Tax=Actinoallomurus vinaceus TaxID=1080074 RepID=A0ABP8UIG7_9ACTN